MQPITLPDHPAKPITGFHLDPKTLFLLGAATISMLAALYAALLDSLKDARDPWQTSREGDAIKQFQPISI